METRWVRLLLCATCSLLIAGCAASGSAFSDRAAKQDKALVYVYRENRILGGANSWVLFANDRAVTDVGNGGYYDFDVDPGDIKIEVLLDVGFVNFIGAAIVHSMGRVALLTFHAEPNQEYFLKFEIGPKITQVTKEEATKSLSGLRRFDELKATQ